MGQIRRPKALLFDMDGTITEPMLDFPAIKAEMGIDSAILEAMAKMEHERRTACEVILQRHELAAAHGSVLNLGCGDLFDWIRQERFGTALVTRNSLLNVRIVLARHGLRFDTLICREDTPPKPDPRPIQLACERLGVAESDAWMIGDGRYDVEAGNAAGVRTVWISHGKERSFEAEPWRTVQNLMALRELVDEGRFI